MHPGFEYVLWFLLITASVTDLMRGKIYNLVTLPAILLGLIAQTWVFGISAVPTILMSVGTALLLFFPLYLIKAMAAGDVKLLMAFSAWSNSFEVFRMAIISVCIGALVGLVILLKKNGLKKSTREFVQFKTRIPFGPAFLCAFMLIKIMDLKGWKVF